MGKHATPSPDDGIPPVKMVSDDTWTKILVAGVSRPDGGEWAGIAMACEKNAKSN